MCCVFVLFSPNAWKAVWIFISRALVAVTHVPVTQSPRCLQLHIQTRPQSSGVHGSIPLFWNNCAFYAFYSHFVFMFTQAFFELIKCGVFAEGEGGCTDLFITSLPKSHHVSRIDSSSSPLCVYDLQLTFSWQNSQTLCFNSTTAPAGKTGALNMTYPSLESPTIGH